MTFRYPVRYTGKSYVNRPCVNSWDVVRLEPAFDFGVPLDILMDTGENACAHFQIPNLMVIQMYLMLKAYSKDSLHL